MPVEPDRVQALFLRAAETPAGERAGLLAAECGGDAELRERVEALLAAHESAESLLDRPPAGLAAGLAASMMTPFIPIIITAGLVGALIPFIHVFWKRKKRFNKFLEHLPDALELMSRALSAGHAFSEALHMVSIEMPEPISKEFRKTYEEQNLGLSLKLALENLTQRMPLLDLRLCVTAVLIQRETGGNLAEILEKVAYTIRERFRILGDLKTLTTSSRLSAWLLCGLPVGVAIAVTVMNPEYMSILWKDPRGHRLIYIAVGLQISGMLLVRKILKIRI
jgi:tight adherence protein B